MKSLIATATLLLLAATPGLASQEPEKPRQEEPKKEEPKKEEPKRHEAPKKQDSPKPSPEKEKARPEDKAAHEKPRPEPDKPAEHAKAQSHQQQDQQKQDQQKQAKRQNDVREHQEQTQRNADNRNARRIREEDFHAHFGREHHFRVQRRDDRHFFYSNYNFEYDQPWPSAWSYDDDVYVDDVDGQYYLIDPVHPGLRLLVVIVG